jgi:hypothetical protein
MADGLYVLDVKSDGASKPKEAEGFLKNVVSAFTLVTAFTFVTGWSYLHAFYSFFGININSLDFPVHQYLVFCYTQFTASIWSALAMSVLVISFFLLTWIGVSVTKVHWALLVSVGYLLLFGGGFLMATNNAKTAAIRYMGIGTPLPKVMLEKSGDTKLTFAAIEDSLGDADLRLLLETKDVLLVFKPVDTTESKVRVSVIAIDRKAVPVSMRVVTVDTER